MVTADEPSRLLGLSAVILTSRSGSSAAPAVDGRMTRGSIIRVATSARETARRRELTGSS
jgi:hypothetical protein